MANITADEVRRLLITKSHGVDLNKANLTSATTRETNFQSAKFIGTIGYKP